MQILDEIHHSDSNFQSKFVSNLQQWLHTNIDKLAEIFPSSLSKKIIEKLAIDSFDSFINILIQENKQSDVDEKYQFLEELTLDDIKQNNDRFFDEVKNNILSQFNHRKHLIEKYVIMKWNKIIDYMQQHDHLKLCLVQNLEKSIQILNQITVSFQQLKSNTISMKQTVEKICQKGIEKIDTYVSEYNEINEKEQNVSKINDRYHCDTISKENELEKKAYELFCEINEQMHKVDFVDFPVLFNEFH